MNAQRLWICGSCEQLLPTPWAPCDCPNSNTDRFLVSPLGLIPAKPLGVGPLDPEQVAA